MVLRQWTPQSGGTHPRPRHRSAFCAWGRSRPPAHPRGVTAGAAVLSYGVQVILDEGVDDEPLAVDHCRTHGRCLPASRRQQAAHPSRETGQGSSGGGWVLDFSAGFVKALGAVEILGAVGLILPALLDIAPILVPMAAVGLALIMVGAAIVTFRRQEFKHVLLNLTYLALLVFVAFGRFFGPESFTG
jgi:hypothetical protein